MENEDTYGAIDLILDVNKFAKSGVETCYYEQDKAAGSYNPFTYVFYSAGVLFWSLVEFVVPSNYDEVGYMITGGMAMLTMSAEVAAFNESVKAVANIVTTWFKGLFSKAGKAAQGAGNIVDDAVGAGNKITQTADDAVKWLGKDGRVITNSSGDKVFLSADGAHEEYGSI